jgi:peptidoglycan/LPS O-acetylase OafA/YrhL
MSVELYGSMLVFGALALFGSFNRFLAYFTLVVVFALLNSPLLAFIFGIVIADAYQSQWRYRSLLEIVAPYLALITLLACIAASIFTPYPRDPRFLSILAAMSVLSVAFCVQVRRFFEFPLSRLLGHISFPLYLTHMFVILSFTSWLFLSFEAHGLGKQAASNYVVILTLPLCFLIAICFLPVESASVRVARWFSEVCLFRDRGLASAKLAVNEKTDRP